MSSQSSKSEKAEKILFEDKDVKITDQAVYIKWYYFPIGKTKVVPLKSIKKIEKKELSWAKYRLWGMDASNWGYWLAGDKNRMCRTHFIGLTVDSSIKPSFTTQSIDAVYRILKQLTEGNRSSEDSEVVQMKSADEEKSMEQKSESKSDLMKSK